MPCGLSILTVEDYAKWKSDFDGKESIAMRKASGQGVYQIFHIEGEPNKIVLLIEWDSLDNMRKFMQSEELQEALKRSGVSQIEGYFLEEVEKGSV